MKFEDVKVAGFDSAIIGMRNPMNSWDKSDSYVCDSPMFCENCNNKTLSCVDANGFIIGDNDINLMQRLIKAGSPNDKFMRQICVWVNITAPLYWWKEADQYRVGVTTDSTSTMHKLSFTPITMDCFETDDYNPDLVYYEFDDDGGDTLNHIKYTVDGIVNKDDCMQEETIINFLENLRQKYLETKDIKYWKELIRWLPESWLQKRMTSMNYSVLRNQYFQRRNHKLTEWHTYCNWIESLPYAKELICLE
jgi:hypothetical protein